MAKRKRLNITTKGGRPIKQVAHDLQKAGLHDQHVLDAIGVITGSADEEIIGKLRNVEGVADISPDIQIQLPDSDETW